MVALATMLAATATLGADYYVSPAGKDTQNGSSGAPFREIRKALTVIAPGDTVHVADGSYKGFDAVGLGSAATTTTLVAPGGKAIITKTTDRGINNPNNIVVWQCTRVVFDGLQSFQAGSAGMRIVECSQVTVRNCVFGDNQRWGIVTSHSDDLLIENNDCYGSIEQHGIYVANSGDRPVVRGNRFHGNGGSGLRSNGDVIQGGDGIITGAVFENNIIYNNGTLGGAAMNLDGLQDGIIRNNVLYDNHATGIALFKGGGAEGPKGMKVLNNTVIMAGDGRYNLRITDAIGPILVRNNFLYNANTIKGPFSWNTPQDAAWTDSDFNAFGGGRFVSTDGESTRISMENWMASGHESHSIPSVSLAETVVNAAAHDYRPKSGSALIDKATTSADVPQDVAGTSRPQGPAPDIGAWEYGAYASWRSFQGFPSSTPATSDPDADGIPLLLEYALNMDPKVASLFGLPVVTLAAGQLHLQYSQFRPDLLYQIEASSDLHHWSTDGIQTLQDGAEHTGSIPASAPAQRRFLRLRVTLP